MFTGIVEAVGSIRQMRKTPDGALITIDAAPVAESLGVGDSICVSGVCLTVTSIDGGTIQADISAETLSRTTLGALRRGDKVNLERALRADGRLGGHFVLGHVDGVGTIRRIVRRGDSWTVAIDVPESVARYIVEKGSVAVDGISLTVAAARGRRIEIAVIPHTMANTTLAEATPGGRVNVEADILGKYVLNALRRQGAYEGIAELPGGYEQAAGED